MIAPLLHFTAMPASDQGIFTDRYIIIPRTLIFITRGNNILLLRGAPTKTLWANLYNGIGGHIEKGEDILSAAHRELREETGLEVENLWLCGTITIDTGTTPGIGIFIHRGECPQGDPTPSEEGILTWIPTDDLMSYPLVEDLYTLLPIVLRHNKGSSPFSGLYRYDDQDELIIQISE